MSIFTIIAFSLVYFVLAISAQCVFITRVKETGAGQVIKDYGPESHKKKSGTPTMGGLIALFLAPVIVISSYQWRLANISGMVSIWLYPIFAALVGLADDTLKYKNASSEGLKSLQKLALQFAVTVPWAVWTARDGISLLPSIEISAAWGTALLMFLGVGALNAVNVTDGLDGLAGGTVAISLISILFWASNESVTLSASAGFAVALAFLWHNFNPAELFMGDVGAHLWAALLLTLCVESRAALLAIPTCFIFGVEIVTVAIQIVSIRKYKKKIFRMSPLHHHYELCGWKEQKIVARFYVAHIVGISLIMLIITYLFGEIWPNVR
ncbi:phospho-N-acetylmuramoyl-pentapeptide-transferase [Synergistales bacterium]|nr:phospho-N-acetylmuramoyl-pentapeptide-transferase [Synergistales bacterium]